MTSQEPRAITYLRLDEIVHAPRNPKRHADEQIGRSIAHHGLAEVPLRDDRTGRLVAGHGRHEQLQDMHAASETPPDGVLVAEDGMWLMPVVTGWASRSDADAEAYLVASNQLTMVSGWENAVLTEVLADLEETALLDLTGFTKSDLDRLTSLHDDELNLDAPPDDFPEVDDDLKTDYQCPKCHYEWSGKPR